MAAPRIAVYLSRHGYGHLIRAGAVLEPLAERMPLRLTVLAAQPATLWPAALKSATEWIATSCDLGVEQTDDVTVDLAATGAAVEDWLARLPQILDRECARLRGGFDLVLGDVPPPAFEAAAVVGVPSIALANFSWDWIYRELGFEQAAAVSAAMYAKTGLLVDTAPSAPMQAFRRRRSVGLVARRPPGLRKQTRRLLGADDGDCLVHFALKGDSASLLRLPAPLPRVRYLLPPYWPRHAQRDDARCESAADFAQLLEAADVVVGKPGYGLLGDIAATATRLLWVARPGFPENAVLEPWLERHSGARRVSLEALQAGTWSEDLRALLEQPVAAEPDVGSAEVVAELLAAHLAS